MVVEDGAMVSQQEARCRYWQGVGMRDHCGRDQEHQLLIALVELSPGERQAVYVHSLINILLHNFYLQR